MSRRDQIIGAALEVFTKKGFSADFTMSSLAKSLDIGKSTLYEYFDNKDDIIREAILKFLEDRFGHLRDVLKVEASTFEEGFKKQLKALLLVATESRTLIDTLSPGFWKRLPTSVQSEVRVKVDDVRETMQKGFIEIFKKAAQEGIISVVDSHEKGLVVTSMVVGSVFLYSDSRTDIDIDVFVDEIYNSALKILN